MGTNRRRAAATVLALIGVLAAVGADRAGPAQAAGLRPAGITATPTTWQALTPLEPTGWTYGSVMNLRGDVAGLAALGGTYVPVLWPAGDRAPVVLNTVGRAPEGLSPDGTSVVFNARYLIDEHPTPGFLWHRGQLTRLDADPAAQGLPWLVNDRGQVAGTLFFGYLNMPPVLWQHGDRIDLPYDQIYGLNGAGQVLGMRAEGPGFPASWTATRGAIWQHGVEAELGTLGGAFTYPAALNDRGQAIGTSTTASGVTHPFRWWRGTMTDLLAERAASTGDARAINASGQVAGAIDGRPAAWCDGHPTFLAGAEVFGVATAINDDCDVAGVLDEGGETASDPYPFVWHDGELTVLDRPVPRDGFRSDLTLVGIDRLGRVGITWNRGDATAFARSPAPHCRRARCLRR